MSKRTHKPVKSIDVLINSAQNEECGTVMLKVHIVGRGFRLIFQSSDGNTWALGPWFTWKQIAQLLIAADPDLFGALSEPLHQVFTDGLTALGYYVPNWRDN